MTIHLPFFTQNLEYQPAMHSYTEMQDNNWEFAK